MWQDIILMAINVLFGYGLIPQIIKGFKEKKAHLSIQTGFIFTIGSYILAFTMLTLNLTFSSIIVFINSTSWGILLIQSIKYKENKLSLGLK